MPRKLLRRLLPDPKRIREHRLLGWMGERLHHPRLWHVSRVGIALGAAIGVFVGLLVPIGQILLAAIVAIALRANLPMAVVGTFVTNAFTFAPIYYFAYRFGLVLLGESQPVETSLALDQDTQGLAAWLSMWFDKISKMGMPLFVGLLTLACCAAPVCYFGISWLWRGHTAHAWRQRAGAKHSLKQKEP